MKKTAFYFLLTAIVLMFVACEKGDDSDPVVTNPDPVVIDPEPDPVYEYWFFKPSSSYSDSAKWDTEDNYVGSEILAGLNSNLVLNYTFDNTVKNTNTVSSELVKESGNYYILVDKTEQLCFQDNFTLCAWINVENVDSINNPIVNKTATGIGDYNYTVGYSFFYSKNEGLSFSTYLDAYDNGIDSVHYDNVSLKTGWHFVTAVYDVDSKLKLYVNGENVRSKIARTLIPKVGELVLVKVLPPVTYERQYNETVDYNLIIGANDSEYFTGSLDQVMVFNRALTAAEISGLYNLQK